MSTPVAITLPISTTAQFPPRCVMCSREAPGHVADLVFTHYLTEYKKTRFTVRVPCCPQCEVNEHRRRRDVNLNILLGFVFYLCLAGALHYFLPSVPSLLTFGGSFILVFGGLAFYLTKDPPPFDISAEGENARYEFLDPELAKEFGRKNGVEHQLYPVMNEPSLPKCGQCGITISFRAGEFRCRFCGWELPK